MRSFKKEGRASLPALRLGVLDKHPDNGPAVIRGHTIALSDRGGRGRRALDFPDAAFGANHTSRCAGPDTGLGRVVHATRLHTVAKMQTEEYRQAARAWGVLLNPIEGGAVTPTFNQGAGSRERIPPFAIPGLSSSAILSQSKSPMRTANVLEVEIELCPSGRATGKRFPEIGKISYFLRIFLLSVPV